MLMHVFNNPTDMNSENKLQYKKNWSYHLCLIMMLYTKWLMRYLDSVNTNDFWLIFCMIHLAKKILLLCGALYNTSIIIAFSCLYIYMKMFAYKLGFTWVKKSIFYTHTMLEVRLLMLSKYTLFWGVHILLRKHG